MLLSIGTAWALTDATYVCSESYCIEGTPINFTIHITNPTNKTLDTGRVEVYDPNFDTMILSQEFAGVRVLPGEEKRFVVESVVVAPPSGYTFQYVTCIYAILSDKTGITDAGRVCSDHTRSLTVLPLEKMECQGNQDCEKSEFCNVKASYRCQALNCTSGHTVWNHACMSYDVLLVVLAVLLVVAVLVYFAVPSRKM